MRRRIERDGYDKDRQNPLGRVVGGHDCRADLEDEPCNNCIAEGDAIDLPLFQLTEERAHLCPVAYVVSAIPIIASSLESQCSFVRQYEVRIRLIATGQTL